MRTNKKELHELPSYFQGSLISSSSVVLPPDVEHEDAGNEEEGHHQDRHWPNLIITWIIATSAMRSDFYGLCQKCEEAHGSILCSLNGIFSLI
jgi:hypothetical protein